MTIEYVQQVVDEIIEVARWTPQERVQQRTVEQIVHVPVPKVVEEIAGVVQIIPQERISKRTDIHTVQKTLELPQVQFLD